jgi:hypothetical protein
MVGSAHPTTDSLVHCSLGSPWPIEHYGQLVHPALLQEFPDLA